MAPVEGRAAPERIAARYVIDASGRHSVLGSHFKLKKTYDHLQKISIFAHYEGVERRKAGSGTLPGWSARLIAGFGSFLLTSARASALSATPRCSNRQNSPEEFLEQSLAEQPLPQPPNDRLPERDPGLRVRGFFLSQPASQATAGCSPVTRLASSIRCSAAAFSSPCSPANNAPTSCMRCSIIPAKRRVFSPRYGRAINRAMDVYLRFVNAWYSKEFIEVFLHPQDMMQIPQAVNAVLGGNVGTSLASAGACRFSIFSSGCKNTFRSARDARFCQNRPRTALRVRRLEPVCEASCHEAMRDRGPPGRLLSLTSCADYSTPSVRRARARLAVAHRTARLPGPEMSLIGEVLVRSSASGELELTFSKGPGVRFCTVRQDDKFGECRRSARAWCLVGSARECAGALRGWFALREILLAADRQSAHPPDRTLPPPLLTAAACDERRAFASHSCRFIPLITRLVTQRRGLVWLGIAIMTAASIFVLVTRMKLDTEVLNLLPSGFDSVEGLKVYNRDFAQVARSDFRARLPAGRCR